MQLPPEPHKRTRLWGNLGVVLVLLVIGAGFAVYFGGKVIVQTVALQRARTADRRARLADLEAQRRELSEASRESVETGSTSGMAGRLAKFSESVGNAADTMSGAERQSLRVAQRMLQSMGPVLANYEAASKELEDAGFVKPETLDSRNAIADRVALVKRFGEANDQMSQMLATMETKVRAELEKEGVPERNRDQFVVGFLKSANVDLNRTIRDCDTELVATLLKMLAVLDREWGGWKAADGLVTFNRDPAIEEYNDLVAKLQEVGERQATAQQSLLDRTSKPTPLR